MSLPRWFTCSRPKTGRRPQNVKKVPFKEEWPLALQNFVSARSGKQKDAPCIKETMAFITCLKDNNGLHEKCLAEGEAVQKCYSGHLVEREQDKKKKKAAKDFIPEKSAKDMTPTEMNRFLSHFPHKTKLK